MEPGVAWFLFLGKTLFFINYILYYMKNMLKIAKSILPLLGLLLSLSLSAQDVAVKGHVKDHTGEPLIGANILIRVPLWELSLMWTVTLL